MPADLPEETRERIEEIRADNTSGAAALAQRAAEALSGLAEPGEARCRETLKEQVGRAAVALVEAQPAMAPIFNLANSLLWRIGAVSDLEETRGAIRTVCRGFVAGLDAAADRVGSTASALIRDAVTVITHSNSQTVFTALLKAWDEGKRFRVVATESRPVREGVTLAGALARRGIPATLIVDAALLPWVAKADLALVGADAVTVQGAVNKTGTALLALACRETRREIYALCGSEKFLPAECRLPPEAPKDPAEVAPDCEPGVSVSNLYFEVTPLDWLTGVITEDGILRGEELLERLAGMKVHPVLKLSSRGSSA